VLETETSDPGTGQSDSPLQPRMSAVAGIAAAIAGAFLILMLPTPEGLPLAGHRMAALFAVALVLFVTEAIPIAITSVLILMLQPIMGITENIRIAFTSWISPVFFFVLVMFIIAQAVTRSGLSLRFALWLLSLAGNDSRRVIWVFVIGTGLMSMIMSDVPACAIFMAIGLGIIDKMSLQPGSRFAKALMIGIPIGALIGGVGTPAGSSINLLGLAQLEQFGGIQVRFLDWMMIGMPMVIVLLPLAAWIITKFYPPEIATVGATDDVARDRAEMGAITGSEMKVIVILGTMVVLWVSSTWVAALDVYAIAIAGAAVMFLPFVNVMTWKEAEAGTGWDTLLLIGGVTSLGAASVATGLAQWLVDASLGGIAGWSTVSMIALISAFTVVIHLALPINPVIVTVLIPPLTILAQQTGVHPALYALPVAFTASCAFLLPIDAVPLITFGKGYYKMFDMFLPGAVLSIVWVILMTALLTLIGPTLGYF
jgi:sodium-dependent dicarboxylate transporter 2/3/5